MGESGLNMRSGNTMIGLLMAILLSSRFAVGVQAVGGDCPEGNTVECFVDPCASTTCLEGQQCVANYCGGCYAECRNMTDTPAPGVICPAIFCYVHPCDVQPTPCQSGETCTRGACPCQFTCCPPACPQVVGSCNAGEERVTDECGCSTCTPTSPAPPGDCPDGNTVNCLVDPCAATTCPVGQQCVSNYCGGCNAECRDLGGDPGGCPEGNTVDCLEDPCAEIKCGGGLECVTNYCGGCFAECKDLGGDSGSPAQAPPAVTLQGLEGFAANQSSTRSPQHSAGKAVDGQPLTYSETRAEPDPYWFVVLNETTAISGVRITLPAYSQFNPASLGLLEVHVSNTEAGSDEDASGYDSLCAQQQVTAAARPGDQVDIFCKSGGDFTSLEGDVLALQIRSNETAVLKLAEVELFVSA